MQQNYRGGNLFLDALPAAERAAFGNLAMVDLEPAESIVARGAAIDAVYFPVSALFSITAELHRSDTAGTDSYEVGVVGREGLVGAEIVLGAKSSSRWVLAQVGGRAACVSGEAFMARVRVSPTLLTAVHADILRRIYAAEQLVGCAFAHTLPQRCARWILTVSDKIDRSHFLLRREFLGMMLGIEDRGVDSTIEYLRSSRAVRYERDGTLTILDPSYLLSATCECYRLLSPHADSASGDRASNVQGATHDGPRTSL